MSPTVFKLSLAAVGTAAILWALPTLLAAAGCKACAHGPDLPRVAAGVIPSRRIR